MNSQVRDAFWYVIKHLKRDVLNPHVSGHSQTRAVSQIGQEKFYGHIFHSDFLNFSKQQSCQGWFPALRLH